MRITLVKTLFLLLLGGQLSCSATVSCPPVEPGGLIALADHGRHSSLIIESQPGRIIRYSFGDWRYYALAQQHAGNGIRALLSPTRAGLGRKELPAVTITAESVRNSLTVTTEEILMMEVDRKRLEALRQKLDQIYRNNKHTLYYNHFYDLEFVHHPERYSLSNNSNRKIARWLEELGCEVTGFTSSSNWTIADAAGECNEVATIGR